MHWIDPDSLPEATGVLDRILVNPDGEVDGFILADGTEIHIPPHMGRLSQATLTPGVEVRVRGVRPRGVPMIAAVTIETEAAGRIVDAGPTEDDGAREEARHAAKAARTPMVLEGVVRRTLHGPKGEVRGVLLEDGRLGRFPPHAAVGLMQVLSPGASVVLRGDGLVTPHGTVLAVKEAGMDAARLIRVGPKPEERGPKPEHGHGKGHKDKRPKHVRHEAGAEQAA